LSSSYLGERSKFIDGISEACEDFQLQSATLHLGVLIFDLFISKIMELTDQIYYYNPVIMRQYGIVAVYIAAKQVENDQQVPRSVQVEQYLATGSLSTNL